MSLIWGLTEQWPWPMPIGFHQRSNSHKSALLCYNSPLSWLMALCCHPPSSIALSLQLHYCQALGRILHAKHHEGSWLFSDPHIDGSFDGWNTKQEEGGGGGNGGGGICSSCRHVRCVSVRSCRFLYFLFAAVKVFSFFTTPVEMFSRATLCHLLVRGEDGPDTPWPIR